MFVLMLISLYTSRVLLQILGIRDYGIYSLVGSITATFNSLRSIFSESIQRFLNYEKGQNNKVGEIQVFNIGVISHVVIAIAFFVIAEIIGPWLLDTKLIIDSERLYAAHQVLHATIISSVFSILIIPFDAVIIANEKMNVYAYISLIDGILRLGVVFILLFIDFDKLVSYSYLLAFIPFLEFIFYLLYSRKFNECRYNFSITKSRFSEITRFAGWNFIGNLFFSLAHEGLNMIINRYGSLVSNASRNIGYQVKNVINQLSGNIILATRPYIIQNAANKSIDDMVVYMNIISRMSYFLLSIAIFPLFVFCDKLLNLWLVRVPENAVVFTRLLMMASLIRTLHGPLDLLYQSYAKIKRMILLESVFLFLLLPISILALNMHMPIWIVFLLMVVMESLIIVTLAVNSSYEFDYPVSKYIFCTYLPCMIVTILIFIIGYGIMYILPNNFPLLIVLLFCLLFALLWGSMLYLLFMNNGEKKVAKRLIESLFRKEK